MLHHAGRPIAAASHCVRSDDVFRQPQTVRSTRQRQETSHCTLAADDRLFYVSVTVCLSEFQGFHIFWKVLNSPRPLIFRALESPGN